MRGKLHRRKGHAATSRDLGGQNRIMNEVKTDWPMQAFVVFIETALDQIADHGEQFIKAFALRRHFRFMADRDERVVFLLNLKNEFLRHG